MIKYSDEVVDTAGNGLAGATVTVYLAGTQTLAELFEDAAGATAADNPLTADSEGEFSFFIARGLYDIRAVKGTAVQTDSSVAIGVVEQAVALGTGVDIDVGLGEYFSKTITGNATFTVSNVPPAGSVCSFILNLTDGGSATVTWWAGIEWAAGTQPTLTAAGRDALGFFSTDGGTSWTGLVLGQDLGAAA
jgi:hypothetical protein